MVIIESWMNSLTEKIKHTFSDRLLFVGLQGSYKRGEAHEDSDIDVVVILDTLSIGDLTQYKSILTTMPEQEKSCGFINGRQEVNNWPKHELFQFVHDTRSYYGNLDDLAPPIQRDDVITGVKIGVSGQHHLCCHTYLHGDPLQLKDLYKGAFFILQAVYYLRHGRYVGSKAKLYPLLTGIEQEILAIGMKWSDYLPEIVSTPDRYCDILIRWCAGVLDETF